MNKYVLERTAGSFQFRIIIQNDIAAYGLRVCDKFPYRLWENGVDRKMSDLMPNICPTKIQQILFLTFGTGGGGDDGKTQRREKNGNRRETDQTVFCWKWEIRPVRRCVFNWTTNSRRINNNVRNGTSTQTRSKIQTTGMVSGQTIWNNAQLTKHHGRNIIVWMRAEWRMFNCLISLSFIGDRFRINFSYFMYTTSGCGC